MLGTKHSVGTEVSVESKDGVPTREEDEDGSRGLEALEVEQEGLQGERGVGVGGGDTKYSATVQ